MSVVAAPVGRSHRWQALPAVIADARRRQRKRRTVLAGAAMLAASVLVVIRLEGTSPSAAGTRQPVAIPLPAACSLLSDALVVHLFQNRMAYKYAQSRNRECTWAGFPFAGHAGQQRVDVTIAPIGRARFTRSAAFSLVPGWAGGPFVQVGSRSVQDLGDSAYWNARTGELAVTFDRTEIYVESTFLMNPLAQEEAVARTVIARLTRAALNHP